MKLDRGLKIALIILLIILISIISFVGIYIQEKKSMINILKDYKFGMDLSGSRIITVAVDTSTKTVYYDKDGNEVEEEAEDGSKQEVPVNSEESLTKENYIKTKKIIEERLSDLKISEYLIRQDENTGKLTVQIPEDSMTDTAIQYVYTVGKFTVEDEENNILLDNSNIKSVKVAYNTTESGTTVFLNIEFNKDSVEKLKEISNNHLNTTDEEGNDISKKITINLDDTTLLSTSFEEEITNGILSLSMGNASTSSSELNSYLQQASNLAILINNGNLPISYLLEQNRYVASDIQTRNLVITGLITSIIVLVGIVVLGVIYKKNGILIGITNIGYIALLLLLIRYTNVILTIEGLFGILVSVILNYIFDIYLLKLMKKNEEKKINVKIAYNKTALAMLLILIPAIIVGITLCFVDWMPIYSFGEIIFWGVLTIFVYNTVITRTLLVSSETDQ